MKKIDIIWQELEQDPSVQNGLILRRYSPYVLPNVFVAIRFPEKHRCLAAFIDNSIKPDISSFSTLQDIRIEIMPDKADENKQILLFAILTKQYEDIFSVLCEDLLEALSDGMSDLKLSRELINRFEKWKSLFEQAGSQGLNSSEQIGLYGELIFLRKLLQKSANLNSAVLSWVGPEKKIRDFQLGSWGVEVKTTHGNNPQKLHISNERQLDTSNIENLFLAHVSLNLAQRSGETLNSIVSSISDILSADLTFLNRFKAKLLYAGYFEKHKSLYDDIGYFIRSEDYYMIENDFPRIEEKDIRQGVGDVKYSIIISQCSGFVINESDVIQRFTTYG